jgi:hypothetical protein
VYGTGAAVLDIAERVAEDVTSVARTVSVNMFRTMIPG